MIDSAPRIVVAECVAEEVRILCRWLRRLLWWLNKRGVALLAQIHGEPSVRFICMMQRRVTIPSYVRRRATKLMREGVAYPERDVTRVCWRAG